MKTKTGKIVTMTALTAALVAGSIWMPGSITAKAGDSVSEKISEKREEIENALETRGNAEIPDRDETVYVITDATGNVNKQIVSDIVNKEDGDPDITTNNADGTLPVDVNITYTLDGNEIAPEDLAGKSGHVTIKFDYTNNEKRTVDVKGKDTEVYVPFAAVSAVLLNNDNFKNVSVDHGRVSRDGSNTLVLGIAFPGLKESLSANAKNTESTVTIECDATDFELLTTVTLVSNEVFKDADLGGTLDVTSLGEKIDSLKEKTDELVNGAAKLADALTELSAGTEKLSASAGQLAEGAKTVSDGIAAVSEGTDTLSAGLANFDESLNKYTAGVEKVSEGLNTISANSETLVAGGQAVLNSSLKSAYSQLTAAGIEVPELTRENYSAVLDKTASALSEKIALVPAGSETAAKLTAAVTAVKTAKAQLDSLNTFCTGLENYTAGVDKAAAGAKQIAGNNAALTAGSKQLTDGAAKAAAGAEQLKDGAAQLADGAGKLYEGTKQVDDATKQIKDGAVTLSTKLDEANLDAVVDEILEAEGDAAELFERLRALEDLAAEYDSYTEKTDDMTGAVKFVYRSAGINK